MVVVAAVAAAVTKEETEEAANGEGGEKAEAEAGVACSVDPEHGQKRSHIATLTSRASRSAAVKGISTSSGF
eukprot:6196826-Pleurochrysis_carterae.AAC.2